MFHERFSTPLSDSGKTMLHEAASSGLANLQATVGGFFQAAFAAPATPDQLHEGLVLALGAPGPFEQNIFHRIADIPANEASAMSLLGVVNASMATALDDHLALNELLDARDDLQLRPTDIAAERDWPMLAKALAPDAEALEVARSFRIERNPIPSAVSSASTPGGKGPV